MGLCPLIIRKNTSSPICKQMMMKMMPNNRQMKDTPMLRKGWGRGCSQSCLRSAGRNSESSIGGRGALMSVGSMLIGGQERGSSSNMLSSAGFTSRSTSSPSSSSSSKIVLVVGAEMSERRS